MGNIRQPIKGFLGENRLLPDDLLPDNVAVDGKNVDYSRGTIKKRRGFTKTHARSYIAGGVRINNAASNDKCLIIRDQTYMDLAGTHTIEFTIRIMSNPAVWSGTAYILNKRSGTDGYLFAYIPASNVWFWQRRDGAGVAQTAQMAGNITAGSHPSVGETYHFAVWRDASNVMGGQITRFSDKVTSAFSTDTAVGDTLNTRDIYIGAAQGAAPAAQICDFIIDELRIWNDQRSLTEIDDCKFRELSDAEVSDPTLIGYWPLNDHLNIQQDRSQNKNNAAFYVGSPCYVPGLVPLAGGDDYALRGDGWDDYGTTGYDADFATITNTGREWAVEFWARLDIATTPTIGQVFLSLGNAGVIGAGQRGAVFIVYTDTAGLLTYSFSTTTTYQNTQRVLTTPYTPEPGVPFHVALVKVDAGATNAIYLYINGVEWDVNSGLNDEAGPSTGTTIGMEFLCYNAAGTRGGFGAVTIDEVRLWNIPRSASLISQYYDRELPNSEESGLIGYWRFNAGDKEKDETGNIANFTVGPTEDPPVCTEGLGYPAKPQGVIKLIAPIAKPIRSDETNAGRPLFTNELLVATKDAFWTQQGTNRKRIKDLDVPGSENLYSFARHAGFVVACNGVGRNYVYQGSKNPMSMTMPTFLQAPTPSVGAGTSTFPATGQYRYLMCWYNINLGLEASVDTTLYGAATLTATTQAVTLTWSDSGITDFSGYTEEVTHTRIYRLDPGATYYRYLTQVAVGTGTYVDTGTSVLSAAQLSLQRSHLTPMNICESHNNRLFMARGSDLYFSEPDSCDFAPTSIIGVDSEDGDAITGIKSGFGVLIVWKKNSIHVLDGDGPNTFSLRKIEDGVGCINHQTISPSPGGFYYLGHDGAYIFNGQGSKYLTLSQQPVFSRISHEKGHLACGVFLPETRQYLVSFDAVTEPASDPAAPSAEAYDSSEFRSLFTHYYRCTTGVDAVGTGETINDADVTFVTDALRGPVAFEEGSGTSNPWDIDVTANTGVTSDFTVGFWKRGATLSILALDYDIFALLNTGATQFLFSFEDQLASLARVSSILSVSDTNNPSSTDILFKASMTALDWHHVVFRKSGLIYTLFVDGVAVNSVTWTDPSFNINQLGNQSLAFRNTVEQYLDNIFWCRNTALTAEQIKGIYDWEVGGANQTERLSFRYDEETGAWAKDDKSFDYLVLAEHASRLSECLAAHNAFVVRVLAGSSDGASGDGDTAYDYTKSGTLTAATGSKLTDAAAKYPTRGDGYGGCEFVAVPTDTTLEVQRRIILKNTATVLYLDSPLISAVTGTYYIAPIRLEWESRYIDGGDPFLTKMYRYLNLWTDATSAAITVKYKTDRDETWALLSLTTSDEFTRFSLRMRGRKVKLRFENVEPDVLCEIQSFLLDGAGAGVVV